MQVVEPLLRLLVHLLKETAATTLVLTVVEEGANDLDEVGQGAPELLGIFPSTLHKVRDRLLTFYRLCPISKLTSDVLDGISKLLRVGKDRNEKVEHSSEHVVRCLAQLSEDSRESFAPLLERFTVLGILELFV